MISYISGVVQKISFGKDSYLDLLTKMDISYRVHIPQNFAPIEKDQQLSLYTHFHVREDMQSLFGFETEEERDFFEELISVSGVGPKIALAVLSTYKKDEVEKIIFEGDAKKLSKVSGLGSKGAQKIILELRGKVDFDKDGKVSSAKSRDLKNALKVLGYTGEMLNEKVDLGERILDKDESIEIEDLIKRVLSE